MTKSPDQSNNQTLLDKLSGYNSTETNSGSSSSRDIEPDFASIISSLSAHSDNNNINNFANQSQVGSESDSLDYAGANTVFRRAGTLSVGGISNGQRGQNNLFVSASISGGISNGLPSSASSGRFMDKFSAVADATREVELLGGGVGFLSIGSTSNRVPSSSRRTSFLSPEGIASGKPFLESSSGSLNESLNNPLNPASSINTRQSISEKIDNYLSNSPVQSFTAPLMDQKSGSGSFASDANISEHNSIIFDNADQKPATSIWNTQKAATATSFTPMMQQQQPHPQQPLQPQNMFPGQFMPNGFAPPHPQMFPYGFSFNQFNGMVPMGSPPLGYLPLPPQQPQQGPQAVGMGPTQSTDSNESESKENADKSGPKKSEILGPQPKRPDDQNGIPLHQFPPVGPGSPPFMYPQAFSPFGFVPHDQFQYGPPHSPIPPQMQHPHPSQANQNFPPIPPAQGQGQGPAQKQQQQQQQPPQGHASNNGNSNSGPPKRNNKSPKNSTP
ncbi:hypothetical protein WICPIJ_009545, partial [Wickerhamomyces pijperi]